VSPRNLLALPVYIAVTYAALLAAFFTASLLVLRLNAMKGARKIQARRESREQIRRDLHQSLRSLALIAVMFGAGYWAYARMGWGIRAASPSVLSIAVSFIVSMLLFDTWFYWLHRLIHSRWLFRTVHLWHHRTSAPEVWSNNSDLLLDTLFLQSYWLAAHFLIPIAPAVLAAHKLYDQFTGAMGHCGYEHAGRIAWPPSPILSVTHHDQHHRFAACNYATHFSLWDRMLGTLHPSHDAEVKRNLTPEQATLPAPGTRQPTPGRSPH
jgi:sterol desaturase/sphingolipid hydroxylase (fatty acid hydroxylase superfamily)